MMPDPAHAGPTPDSPERKAWYKRVPTPAWGLLALAVGMGLGILYPEQLAPIGKGVKDTFGYIGKAAPYIIFLSLVPAIIDMMRTGSAAKFAFWVSAAFTVSTFVAAIVALILVALIFQLDIGTSSGNFLETVRDALAHASTSLTSPPFIAVGYGIAVALFLHFGSRTRALAWFCKPTADVYHTIGTKGIILVGKGMKAVFPGILFAMGVFIPTSVTSSLAAGQTGIGGAGGAGSENPIVWYFVCLFVTIVCLFAYLGLFSYISCRVTGFPFKRFVKEYFAYVYPFGWVTASSTATIPINLERAEKGLDVRPEVREFIIPLGASVNLDGTMVAIYVLTVVAGILVGYPPTVLQLALLTIPLGLAIHGVPGIPGGVALIAPPLIAAFLGIPAATVGLFTAIWTGFALGLNDQFRSGVNSVNNGIIALLFERYYDRHFTKTVPIPVGAGAPAAAAAPEPDAPRLQP